MIRTWFPEMSKGRMIRTAHQHTFQYSLFVDQDRSVSSDARAVVNWLRHECTDYDEDQNTERHQEACNAIAKAFPWLRKECTEQISKRHRADREAAEMAEAYEQEQHQKKLDHQALIEASKAAIAGMSVGQKVSYRHNANCIYDAEITKIGRSKVTVAYEVKTGKDRSRSATVYAALLTPRE